MIYELNHTQICEVVLYRTEILPRQDKTRWGRKKGGFIIISMQIIICSSKLKWIENVYIFWQLADQIHTYTCSKNNWWLYDAFNHDKIQNYWMDASMTSKHWHTEVIYLHVCICDQNHLLHVHLYNLQVIVFFKNKLTVSVRFGFFLQMGVSYCRTIKPALG